MVSGDGKAKKKVQMVLQLTPDLKAEIQDKAAEMGMAATNYVAFVMHNHFKQEKRFQPLLEKMMEQLPAEIGKALKEQGEDALDLLVEFRKERKEEV